MFSRALTGQQQLKFHNNNVLFCYDTIFCYWFYKEINGLFLLSLMLFIIFRTVD